LFGNAQLSNAASLFFIFYCINLQWKALNREIVKCLVDATIFLAKNCISFLGHRENRNEENQGNFLNLKLLLSIHHHFLHT